MFCLSSCAVFEETSLRPLSAKDHDVSSSAAHVGTTVRPLSAQVDRDVSSAASMGTATCHDLDSVTSHSFAGNGVDRVCIVCAACLTELEEYYCKHDMCVAQVMGCIPSDEEDIASDVNHLDAIHDLVADRTANDEWVAIDVVVAEAMEEYGLCQDDCMHALESWVEFGILAFSPDYTKVKFTCHPVNQ